MVLFCAVSIENLLDKEERTKMKERKREKDERREGSRHKTGDDGNSPIVLATSMVCRNSCDNEGVIDVTTVTNVTVSIDFELLRHARKTFNNILLTDIFTAKKEALTNEYYFKIMNM